VAGVSESRGGGRILVRWSRNSRVERRRAVRPAQSDAVLEVAPELLFHVIRHTFAHGTRLPPIVASGWTRPLPLVASGGTVTRPAWPAWDPPASP